MLIIHVFGDAEKNINSSAKAFSQTALQAIL
jgi:hypothetical protein